MGEKKGRSMHKRITRAMSLVGAIIVIGLGAAYLLAILSLRQTLVNSNKEIGSTTKTMSYESMNDVASIRIQELASGKAELVDSIFREFENNVKIIADTAGRLYDNQEAYAGIDIPLPDAANDGKLAVQLLFSKDTDAGDEDIIREARLLGNAQDILIAINRNCQDNGMASDYIATETGIMVQADYISGKKFDENGNILPYEAMQRPWYIGAKETGKLFYTDVAKDAHTDRLGIMCGVPIFHNGSLMGVAGSGMYLDSIKEIVNNIELGENSDACVINQNGSVLFSTRDTETVGYDLRTSEKSGMADVAKKAAAGENGITLVEYDGKPYYVAYAPMETVGWSFMIFLSKEHAEAPADELLSQLNMLTEKTENAANMHIKKAFLAFMLVIGCICIVIPLVAFKVARRIARPINKLTDSVKKIEGDTLNFEWDEDTGDETQVLALSFEKLTRRIKTYIEEVQTVTAEKERISTELNVATQIQANMLPCIFPAFPERKEFDIYASMTPAKEVGGDFYDFYLLDDDHLAMVMADVSGKGVPAALFMVISKTLLKDHARSCGSPAKILEKVNNLLYESNAEGMFVTVWLGIMEISTGRIVASNAGHEIPALRSPDGNFELVRNKHGMMIGAMPGITFKEYEMQLEHGSTLFLYTDGVPEATNAQNELFNTDRMIDALNINPAAEPERLLANVKGRVDEFVGEAPQFDDLTMLAIVRK